MLFTSLGGTSRPVNNIYMYGNYNFTNNYSLLTETRVYRCQYYLNSFFYINFVFMLEDLRVNICRCLFGLYKVLRVGLLRN